MLNYDLCIKIINRLTPIFTKDVNIIGLDGIIIASSNKKREKTYHEGARISASSNRNVIITESNKHMYRGCKEGVNMPITYNNKVIGVVGITGTAEEVMSYGPLIKELVELIVNEIDIEHPKKVKKNNINNYFKEIIQGIQLEDLESYNSRGKLLEIDIQASRKMVVFKSKEDSKSDYRKIESFFYSIINNLNVEILNLYNKKLVLLFPNNLEVEKYIDMLIDKLILEKINNYKFIIGEECKNILDYEKVYSQICLVESIENNYEYKKVINVSDYDIKLLIRGISNEYKNRYIQTHFSKLFEGKNKLSDEMKKTIRVYFTNNMKICETAQAMYVHRNTVMYRLNKFKFLYGIDLTKPYECTKIYLAILIYEEISRELKSINNID